MASSRSRAKIQNKGVPPTDGGSTKFLREDLTWQNPGASSYDGNPATINQTSSYRFVTDTEKNTWNGNSWTYVVLDSDFTISTTANNSVTGLAFTPAANTRYLIEGLYLLRTATTTTGARPGHSWPTGYTDGAGSVFSPNSLTASAQRWQQAGTTANAASTGLPSTTNSYMATMQALLIMGASPSGNFQVTLASETAAVNVTMRAGSLIRYREY